MRSLTIACLLSLFALSAAGQEGAPATSRTAAESRPTTDDPALRRVLDRSLAQMRSAAALEGEWEHFFVHKGAEAGQPERSKPFFVQRPGRWLMRDPEFEKRSDGKTNWTIQRGRRRYIRQENLWTLEFGRHLLTGFEAVLGETKLPDDLRLSREKFDGRECVAARFRLPAGFDRVVFIEIENAWPAGYEQVQTDGSRVGAIYRKVRAAEPLKEEAFTWSPEPDFVEIDLKKPARPLPVGAEVPDAAPPVHGGGAKRLSEWLADRKALLLDFWFVECEPCRRAMPVVAGLAAALKDQGLELVTVNFGDSEERIAEFLAREKLAVHVVRNGVGKDDLVQALGVPSFPSLFLIGADRKVLWREVGFSRAALETALKDAGFELPKGRK